LDWNIQQRELLSNLTTFPFNFTPSGIEGKKPLQEQMYLLLNHLQKDIATISTLNI